MSKTIKSEPKKNKVLKKSLTPNKPAFRPDLFIIEIAGRFGITGACVLAILYVFIKEGSLEQHRYFIDKFILLKVVDSNNNYTFFIALILIVLFIGQNYFFRKKGKLKDQRIEELETYVSLIEPKYSKKS